VDVTFSVGAGANDFINALLLQSDGKVLVGGGFTNISNLTNSFGIARLQTNGLVDATFTPNLDFVAFGSVFSIALQSNGKIFIGGNFSSVGGVSRPSFARLNADGTLDSGFVPDAPNSAVTAIGLQSSGDIILAGGMAVTDSHGNIQFGVARLHGDPTSSSPHPLLAIRFTSINTVLVSWPSPSAGFNLQQNTNLDTANWIAPSESVTDNGTQRFIIVNPPTGNRYYRLFKP
jgi:uncharacterized delta-60 repeat protein